MTMNENMMRNQFYNKAYYYLSQARNIYQIYMGIKQDISYIDNKITQLTYSYSMNPIQQNILEQKQLTDSKFQKQIELQRHTTNIANSLCLSTQNALQALQISLKAQDSMGVMLDNNTINTICSFIEFIGTQTDVVNAYRQYCNTGVMSFLISDINIKKMMSLSFNFSGFDKLKSILNRT